MSLLRKSRPEGERDDGIPVSDRAAMDKAQARDAKRQKAAQRSAVMARTREARKAAGAMKPPEPMRALYCGLALLALAAYSFFSNDVQAVDKTVHGKTTLVYEATSNKTGAIILAVLVLVTLATLYWRRRIVTVVAFMLTAAFGVNVPLPKDAQDLKWVAFVIPAAYALWVWAFRMRKDQQAWLAANGGSAAATTTTSRAARTGGTTAAAKGQKTAATARGRKPKEEPVVGLNGRALPPNTGRYTRPHAKPRQATQHRS